jgi:hypothetical protein
MISYFGNDVKRVNHSLKVFGYSEAILSGENVDDNVKLLLRIASILHDIGIKEAERKYNSAIGKYQEIEGPYVAKKILSKFNIVGYELERILFLIGNHHSYGKIDGLDFQILVEADFLVNIFEDNLNRETIKKIRKNYFKTKTGILLIDKVFSLS